MIFFYTVVDLNVFAKFNKLKALTDDMTLVAKALTTSQLLEVNISTVLNGLVKIGSKQTHSINSCMHTHRHAHTRGGEREKEMCWAIDTYLV